MATNNAGPDYALRFDGQNDYIETPGYADVNAIGAGNFTIEATFRADTIQPLIYPGIVSNRISGSGILLFLAPGPEVWQQGKPWINIQDINYPCSGCPSLTDGKWHHVAVERFVDTLYFYVDGVFNTKRTLIPAGRNISSTGSIRIGNDQANSSETYFKGDISDVRIWNYARKDKIPAFRNTRLSSFETGLVGYWDLNEGAGQIIHNQGGNSANPVNGTVGITDQIDPEDPVWINTGQ